MHGVFILHTIISSVTRKGNTGRTFSQRTLYTIQRISIPPHCHFERSEKSSLHSALSCFLRKRFPLFRCLTYGAIPVCKKDPSASLGMTIREECVSQRTLYICMMHEISIPYTIISSAARNLFRFPFPSSFAKPFRGSTVPTFPAIQCFPFLAVGHAPSYRQRKRSLDFARDDVAEVAFSQHTLYTGRGLSIPPYRHFERSREIFLARRRSLLLSLKVSHFPLSHIERYTSVQERSLGFARDDVA